MRLFGAGLTGVGEDVTYDEAEQAAFQQASHLRLAGAHTLDSFSELIGALDLFPTVAPRVETWRLYRRWAFESAALDLALRQAGLSLVDALQRESEPVNFVVSLRLPDPPTTEPVRRLLDLHPGTRFKLDPTTAWDDRLIDELAGTSAVDVVDFKSAYPGTWGEQPPDAAFYERVVERFRDAWIEDPNVHDAEIGRVLRPHRDRVTWDAVIHSVADVEALPFVPRMLNSKPSRFGSAKVLFDFYDYCAAHSIGLYGGGQFELGPGRGQIQALASLFHPNASNDVAPGGYNLPEPTQGLESSPLEPMLEPTGFGRLQDNRVGRSV